MPVENEAGLSMLRVSRSMQPIGHLAFRIGKDQEATPCQTSSVYVAILIPGLCPRLLVYVYVLNNHKVNRKTEPIAMKRSKHRKRIW